jgi:predicted ester cyclase
MSTTIDQNKALIRRFFEAWNGRQPDAFDDLIAPDVVRHCEATPRVQARSLGQVKEFLRQDTAVFPDSVQTIKLLVAEGNLVAAWTTYEGTQQGPLGLFPPSGRKAQFDFGAVLRIEGGKIAEWSSRTTCSGAQIVEKPSRSAVMATLLTHSGSTVGPIPTAKYPISISVLHDQSSGPEGRA